MAILPVVIPNGSTLNFSGTVGETLTGSELDDLFRISGSIGNIDPTDRALGLGGTDTLAFLKTDVGISNERLAGLQSIEQLDFTASVSGIIAKLDRQTVDQADGDQLSLIFGGNAMLLDTADVGGFGTVVLQGSGQVTLRNLAQSVTVGDGVDGNVLGGRSDDIVRGGNGNDVLKGGVQDLSKPNSTGFDTLIGNDGSDTLTGLDGEDNLDGGAGNDVIDGGLGKDLIASGAGIDVLTGGGDADIFKVSAGNAATITDFDLSRPFERIDVSAVARSFSDLSISYANGTATVSAGTTTVTLQNVGDNSLSARSFIFDPDAVPVFTFAAGTPQALIQNTIDDASTGRGAIIQLGAGRFEFGETLTIGNSNITLKGAGENETVIVNTKGKPGAVISAQSQMTPETIALRTTVLTEAAQKGSNQVKLGSTEGMSVGDILHLKRPNDAEFEGRWFDKSFKAPTDYFVDGQPNERYFMQEAVLKVTAIEGNTVTLSHKLPYDFKAGVTTALNMVVLRNVHLSDFTVEASSSKPDPFNFENTLAGWEAIATVQIDRATESSIANVTALNNPSTAFRFQRVFGIEADNLRAEGAHNKGENGNGYAFLLDTAFANTLKNLEDVDMRHSVLFSALSAEHYNDIGVQWTNRDINFHGSPDADNIVSVYNSIASYKPRGGEDDDRWPAVGPGPLSSCPLPDIEANIVVFKKARTGDSAETLYAIKDDADIDSGGGDDTIYGAAGLDLLSGADGNDTIDGAGSRDKLTGGAGLDRLLGGDGDDTIKGGADADLLDGEAGGDDLQGEAGDDMLKLRAGDRASGGGDSDVFEIRGAGSVTITDFDADNAWEKLDLRGIQAATGYAALDIKRSGSKTIVKVGGAEITLENVKRTLAADSFLFVGDTTRTLAGDHTTLAHAPLSSSTRDKLSGDGGNNIFEGTANQLHAGDVIAGGGGTDTLRFNSPSVGLTSSSKLAGLQSIERLDVSNASGTIGIALDAKAVTQAGGTLTILGGTRDMSLDTSAVGKAGKVFVETTGTVALKNLTNNTVYVADTVKGDVVGGAGKDMIVGGKLADRLFGGNGDDVVNGGGGDDLLAGGAKVDILTGGAGADAFLFDVALGKVLVVDRLTDFSVKDDTIQLDGTAFAALAKLGKGASFALPATAFKNIALGPVDANDRIIYNSKTGDLAYDVDGSGKVGAHIFAHLDNNAVLTAADFLVV